MTPRLSVLARARLTLVVFLSLWLGVSGIAYGQPLMVFVSILPQKQFAEAIGGRHVRVRVMVGSGQNPVTYEPTPRQMTALAQARAYWRIGVPFEQAWIPRLQVTNRNLLLVDARDGIALRQMQSTTDVLAPDSAQAGAAVPHAHQGAQDPHIWLSPPLVKRMCKRFMDALIELDPTHAADYRSNFSDYARRLDRLDFDIRQMLSGLPSRRFMVFHPAWGYFADAYGLAQIPVEIEGKSPGPRTLAALIDLARRDDIHVIFVQPQFSRANATTVAQAVDGKLLAVDPLAADYFSNLRRVARVFSETLQ